MTTRTITRFVALLLFFVTGYASAEPIELWTRKRGSYVDGGDPGKTLRKRLDLATQPKQAVRKLDVQYGETHDYRGVALVDVVESYPWLGQSDLLLLHFDNGMVVPLPLDDALAALRQVDLFIASAWRDSAATPWSTTFPSVVSYDERYHRESRKLDFAGNKVVTAVAAHPLAISRTFSPWRHVTALTGLEFADRAAYYQQFLVRGVGADDPGFRAFQGRCQFCHGLRGVGASFGWDFLEPVPIYELKRPEHLYNKVKYPYLDALERGLLMPTQPDVTEPEMDALWRWLKRSGSGKQRSYSP